MKRSVTDSTICSCIGVAFAAIAISSSAGAQVVDLCLTGSWTAGDFSDLANPPTSDPAADGKVLGVSPSDGSFSLGIELNLDDSVYFPDDGLYGYPDVVLARPPGIFFFGAGVGGGFGAFFWEDDKIVDLQGPENTPARLWTRTDLTTGPPEIFAFRMFGTAPDLRDRTECVESPSAGGLICQADAFFGGLFTGEFGTGISGGFLLWEYFGGERISTNTNASAFFGSCEVGDSDGDGYGDDLDNCPFAANPGQENNDGDLSGDPCDPDDDNDGINDDEDDFPFDDSESNDNDDDGTGDNADPDDDNDGQSDEDEAACGSDPLDDSSTSPDFDADDSPDCVDSDDDDDGIDDSADECDFDDPNGFDADQDGCTDTTDGLSDEIDDLIEDGAIDGRLASSLQSKVANAASSADDGDICVAINKLEAFLNQVEAQTGKKITEEAADTLIEYIDNIISGLLAQLPPSAEC